MDNLDPSKLTHDEKIDLIVMYLHRMDRRDKLRMTSGIIHSILSVIPLILSIAAFWYLYTHGAELISQAARDMFTGSSNTEQQGFMDQLQQYFGQ